MSDTEGHEQTQRYAVFDQSGTIQKETCTARDRKQCMTTFETTCNNSTSCRLKLIFCTCCGLDRDWQCPKGFTTYFTRKKCSREDCVTANSHFTSAVMVRIKFTALPKAALSRSSRTCPGRSDRSPVANARSSARGMMARHEKTKTRALLILK